MRKEKNIITKCLIFSLGMTSIIFQVIILREFLSVVQGNELTIGIILSSWLLLTGIGALTGKISSKIANKTQAILLLHFLFTITPPISVLIIRYFWYDVFLPGVMLGIVEIVMTSLLILLPFTFLSGFLFTLYCSQTENKEDIGKNYSTETAGSVIGGILASIVLMFILNTIQIILAISLFNLILLIYYSLKLGRIYYSCCFVVIALFFTFLIITDLDDISKSRLFPNQKLIEQKETPFGNVAVTKSENQINIYQSGILTAAGENTELREEIVHFAMVQHKKPKEILIIGGGSFGLTDELLKYQPSSIVCIEQNDFLLEINNKYFRKLNPKVNFIEADAFIFLDENKNKYDVIILNMAPPSTLQLNRYYSKEFFALIKRHLNAHGIFSLKMPSTANYVSKNAAIEQSIILTTIKYFFQNVIIIPSYSNYFIASTGKLTYDIPGEIDKRNIQTKYVNKFYLNQLSLMQRADLIYDALDSNAAINSNFNPISFYSRIDYFLSYFDINQTLIIIFIIFIFGMILFWLKASQFIMFSVGFALSLSEIIIIMSFQIIFGFVYQYIGIIFSLFMAGMSFGAYFILKKRMPDSRKSVYVILFLISIYLLSLPFIFRNIEQNNLSTVLLYFIFCLLILYISVFSGMIFSGLSLQSEETAARTAGNIYSADLFGSSLSAILVAVFLIPNLGFDCCCFSGAGLVLIAFLASVQRKFKQV